MAELGRSAKFAPTQVHAFVSSTTPTRSFSPRSDPNRAYTVTEAAAATGLTADTVLSGRAEVTRGCARCSSRCAGALRASAGDGGPGEGLGLDPFRADRALAAQRDLVHVPVADQRVPVCGGRGPEHWLHRVLPHRGHRLVQVHPQSTVLPPDVDDGAQLPAAGRSALHQVVREVLVRGGGNCEADC